jgi:RNA 2',3'-cyclic 3'-phosphodiesterase
LGNVEAQLIPDLERHLDQVFSGRPIIEVQVFGVGAFPNLLRPRVVWAGLKDPGATLEPLARRVDASLESFGFKREKRPFNPHLTLGRVRTKKGISSLVEEVRQKMDLAGPDFTADHAVLYQSILKPTGAEYVALRNFDFSDT